MNIHIANESNLDSPSLWYDISVWTNDLGGLRFRNSYNDRFGKPGQERQGDGNETSRSITFTYAVTGENDNSFILDAEELYGAIQKDNAPFYLVDTDTERRLKVSIDELDLTAKPGTELRYSSARLRFTALDTFWEATEATEVTSPTAGTENQGTLTCNNPRKVTAYPIITITPSESNLNFALFNETMDDVFTFSSSSFVPGSSLEINSQDLTVYLTNIGTRTEVSSGIADGTGFLELQPGQNIIRYESAYGAVDITISYRERWPF